MDDTIRWTVKVSPETDRSLRSFLGQHGMKKGDLSKFIERAVHLAHTALTEQPGDRVRADSLADGEVQIGRVFQQKRCTFPDRPID